MTSKLTSIPLSLVQARGLPGSSLKFNGNDIVLEENVKDENDFGINKATYDALAGALTMKLRNGTTILLEGFPTINTIGTGPRGPTGPGGREGRDGLNGEHGKAGPTGCMGPEGPRGRQGPAGEMGPHGPTGPAGPDGPTGPAGQDGIVQTWIQSKDPMETAPDHVIAGALWVKP